NETWLSERSRASTLAMLREMNVPMVTADEPQGFKTSIPAGWEATSADLAVERIHGRDQERRMKKGLTTSALPVNYRDSEEELRELAKPVEELASQTRQVHVMFNNCYEDKAQVSARQFRELLGV